jgi:hypothetical protein
MRFLKVFFFLVLVGLATLFVWRYAYAEVVMWQAGRVLAADMLKLRVLAYDREGARECLDYARELGVDAEKRQSEREEREKRREYYQLRFVTNTDYVIEVDCRLVDGDPLILSQNQLPRPVVKLLGSGVLLGVEEAGAVNSSVVLAYQDRLRAVGFEDGTVKSWRLADISRWQANRRQQPATSCEAWGYECCDPTQSVGSGEQLSGEKLLTCSKSCYESCSLRPVVIYFNSDPVMDPRNRTAVVYGDSELVQLGYQIEDFDSEVAQVSIDFGDGEVSDGLGATGIVSHEYNCQLSECRYTATLSAVDNAGLDLAETALTSLTIIMRPN